VGIREKLTREHILTRLNAYGFLECENAMKYLLHICNEDILSMQAFRYVYSEITECLKNHATDISRYGFAKADAMSYFQDLKLLRKELEFVISIIHS